MRWNLFLLYLIVILTFSTSIAFLVSFMVGWTFTNFIIHLFIVGLVLVILGTCFSVGPCDEVVYTHRPINPALVRDVQENPVRRVFGDGEGRLALIAAGGILLALVALFYILALALSL
jgi:hypothetical protein